MNQRPRSLGSLCGSLLVLGLVVIPATATAFDRFVNPFATCPPNTIAGKPTHDTIQAAIDAAAVGDLIGVCAGTYAEAISVDTDDLTIRPTGASAVHVVAPGPGGPSFGFDVSADGVTILGFEVSGFADDVNSCGIRATGTSVTVTENDVHDNAVGICLLGAIAGLVNNNRIRDNHGNGLFLLFGRDNVVTGNRVLNNHGEGINDVATLRSLLQKNVVNDNTAHGIISNSSVDARISRNSARGNGSFSFMIHFSTGAVVDHNVATDGPEGGVLASNSTHCTVSLNRASGNPGMGIGALFSSSCLFDGNRAIGNGSHGILLVSLGAGNVVTRNVATGNGVLDCQWDGSDAPVFVNNACTTESPAGAWN